jgi:FixJ family two-component response regulator
VSHIPLIAIVDDDLAIREALEDLIKSHGYDCRLFGSAEEFLQSATDVECVVVDVEMPGMNGLEMQQTMNRRSPRPPTIFVTSYTDKWTRTKALEGGAFAIFGKPVDVASLITTVEAAVGRPRPSLSTQSQPGPNGP